MAKHDKVGPFRIVPNKQRGGYQVDIPAPFSETGKRQRPLFPTKIAAKKEADRRYKVLSDRLFGKPFRKIQKSGIDLHSLATQWTAQEYRRVELKKLRASSLETSLYYLNALTSRLGDMDIAMIGIAEMEDYQKSRMDGGKSPATINHELARLKTILGYAKKSGIIQEVPSVSALREDEIIAELPTIEEMQSIISHIHPNRRVLLLLIAETGCRKNEAQTLPWKHVNQIKGTIKFQQYTNKTGCEWRTKRASSVREIPISKELLREIHSLEKVSEYVFPGRDPSKPLNNFRKALITAVRKSGIKRNGEPIHVTPQIIRKAVLTWHVEKGTPESIAQALCGHSKGSRVTQKVYINHQQNAIAKAIIQMSSEDYNENQNASNLATNGNKAKIDK